jgi:PHD/YefM family antitoxin component YafN of YafNO toxin-antitoxin module
MVGKYQSHGQVMDLVRDIQSLSYFTQKPSDFLKQLKETGKPIVLTVDGKAELIVQDAASYQALLEAEAIVNTLKSIQRGLEQTGRGEGIPREEALAQRRELYGIK